MNRTILIGLAAFVVGILASGAVASYAVNGNHTRVMGAYGMHMNTSTSSSKTTGTSMGSMSMDDMDASLKGKSGDEFDKVFISDMIAHHQGAIDMANQALTSAKHQEIKDMAKSIISAQSTEITQMQNWQSEWGYSTSSSNDSSMPGMNM